MRALARSHVCVCVRACVRARARASVRAPACVCVCVRVCVCRSTHGAGTEDQTSRHCSNTGVWERTWPGCPHTSHADRSPRHSRTPLPHTDSKTTLASATQAHRQRGNEQKM